MIGAHSLCLLITACACSAQSGEIPGESIPEMLRAVTAALDEKEELRVDLDGALWTWQADTQQATRFGRDGGRTATARLPSVRTVDAHSQWGLLGVTSSTEELQHFDWQGTLLATVPLNGPTGSVAWVDETLAAVTPKLSETWVEIWDVGIGAQVHAFGEAEPVTQMPGGRFARGVHVRASPEKNRLYTLESRTGEARIFSLGGNLLRRVVIDNPRRPEYDAWLAAVAPDYTERGESFTPTIWQLGLAVGDADAIWTVAACGFAEDEISLVEIPTEGNVTNHPFKSECCPQALTAWGTWLVLQTPPGGSSACRDIRRLP